MSYLQGSHKTQMAAVACQETMQDMRGRIRSRKWQRKSVAVCADAKASAQKYLNTYKTIIYDIDVKKWNMRILKTAYST